MTDKQFEVLLEHLTGIKNSIESLKGSPNAKSKYDLSDLWSEMSSVTSAVGSVENAIDKLGK